MGDYKKLYKNFFMLIIGNFVTRILSFLMVPFYTSFLTPDEYGISDLISTTILLVLPFFSMLMDEALMRFALDDKYNKLQVFSVAFCLSTIGFFIFLIFSPLLLFFDNLKDYYIFFILYYVSLWLYNIFSCYVKGLDRVSIISVAGVIHTFSYLIINILGVAVFRLGIIGYLLAIDLSNIIAALFLFFKCKLFKYLLPIKKIDWNISRRLVNYSLPMIPDYISWWFNNASDRYILTFFHGTFATGLYSVAFKIPSILNVVTQIFSSAWKISSVDDFGSKESEKFYSQVYAMYSSFVIVIASILILLTEPLALFLFNNDFYSAWRITPILILAYVFSAQAIFLSSIFTASKQTKKISVAASFGAFLNIILNFTLIPKYCGLGAAIATTIGYFSILFLNACMTQKILKINLRIGQNAISYCLIIIEILALLYSAYSLVLVSVFFLILINIRELLIFVKTVSIKYRSRNKLGE